MTTINYSCWISTPQGERFALLSDLISLSCNRVVNNVGALELVLPKSTKYEWQDFEKDCIIEVWRNESLLMDTIWFVQSIKRQLSESGEYLISLTAKDANYLLETRIVDAYAGSSGATKSGFADDVMKEFVYEQIVNPTNISRIFPTVSVQSNRSAAPFIKHSGAWKTLISVLRDISDSVQTRGTYLAYDMVARNTSSIEFRTYINQRGRPETSTPIVSPEQGNISSITRTIDYTDSMTNIIVAGQGEGVDRVVVRMHGSDAVSGPYSWTEIFKDGRGSNDVLSLVNEGYASLFAKTGKKSFEGEIINSDSFQFGRDFNFGDKLRIFFDGEVIIGRLDTIRVDISKDGERISARIRDE